MFRCPGGVLRLPLAWRAGGRTWGGTASSRRLDSRPRSGRCRWCRGRCATSPGTTCSSPTWPPRTSCCCAGAAPEVSSTPCKRHCVTGTTVAPTMLAMLLRHPVIDACDTTSTRRSTSGDHRQEGGRVRGGSGMGRASAELLAAQGASVAIADLADSAGEDVAAQLGGTFHARRHRLRRCRARVERRRRRAGRAAHHRDHRRWRDGAAHVGQAGAAELDAFRRILDLNTVGTFTISRLAAAHMNDNSPRTVSAASSSTPRRSPRSGVRSVKSPTQRPRPRSPGCA